MTGAEIAALSSWVDEASFLAAGAVLVYELVVGASRGRLKLRAFQDMFASVSTQLPYLVVELTVLGFVYVSYLLISEQFVGWVMPNNAWVVIATVLACDFVYYWEHRFAHEVRVLWTQHAVHHSSRFMNVLVAFRFGPLEGLVSGIIHLPLVLIGFPPELVFFGILAVLAYQGWIHTEAIGRLGVLDRVLNTPSNHRVHHGCDEKYLDKNYGGILIVWDRIFGTYQAEEERPRFGLKRNFASVNPFKVWVSEWPGLFRDLKAAGSAKDVFTSLFAHPARAERQSK